MSRRKRTYPLRRIKENYTYTLEQIADLFGIDLMTVRRWVRHDGLARIPKIRPYMVHNSALKAFLHKRQSARKQKCGPGEVYCLKCRCPRIPEKGTGRATIQPNNCMRFQARCGTCGSKMNRVIKAAEWSKNHPLANYIHDAPKQHKGAHPPHRECHIQKVEQLCLNITP